jgi:hypothetical protein
MDVVAHCYRAIASALPETKDADRILKCYREYNRVEKWRKKAAPDVSDETRRDARSASQDARDTIREAMAEAGLLEPFHGALMAGPVFQSLAKAPEGGDPGTALAGAVLFESAHLGSPSDSWLHASVGGKVGYEPIFLMTSPKGSVEGPVEPLYSGGFVWDIGANLGFPVNYLAAGEITVFGRYGQGRPGPAEIRNEKAPTSEIAIPVAADGGLTRDYWEAGVRAVLFRNELAARSAHLRGYLFPAASIHAGLRWDKRFSKASPLTAFNSPERRAFFGFRINALRVFKDVADRDGAYELTFGVEREWALREGGLPSGTRIIVAGSINLLKAFGGPSSKKEEPAGSSR